jgi:integrase
LEFSDVDFEKSTVQFNKQVAEASAVIIGNEIPANHKLLNRKLISPYTKTNTIKTVSIPSWLLEDIKIWQQKNHSNFIFASNGGIMSRCCVASRLKKHLELAGLHKIRVHDLRHSHTTLLYESGCDAKYVAERLGHSTEITSLNTYKHLSQRKKDSNDDIIKGLKL